MSKNSSAKYSKKYRKTEKKLAKGIKVFLKKRKTKQQDSIVKNNIKISQNIKKTCWISKKILQNMGKKNAPETYSFLK